MIKMFFPILIISILGLMPSVGVGAENFGGGGVAVYCANEKDPASRIQFFDLWEGNVLLKTKPLPTQLDYATYALSFAPYLNKIIGGQISFEDRIQSIVSLPTIRNSNHVMPRS